MLNGTDIIRFIRGQPRWRLLLGMGLLALAGWFWFRSGGPSESGTTFTVRRGPLDITILEGGSVEALESQEIRSEIKGMQGTKILKIVDEGYLVTEDDVKNGKVLVELDSSEIRQRIITEEIQFQSTLAGLTEAQQAYEIQLNQNITDIKAAEQKARFARMDFEKFMGEQAAKEILDKLGFHEESLTNAAYLASVDSVPMPEGYADGKLMAAFTNVQSMDQILASMRPPTNGVRLGGAALGAADPPKNTPEDSSPGTAAPATNLAVFIDFTQYAKTELLGDGAANQQLRKLQDDEMMSQTELKQADTKLEGTKRLFAKQFVTKTELENDQITVDKAKLKVKTAQTALELFIKYEFVKSAEEFLAKYDEALRGLERTRKEAISKLAQAQAKLRSAEGRFKIEAAQRAELAEQLEKCVIKAQKCGLVVYGMPSDHYFGGQDPIREGTTVRERQRIITIPDMTLMSVRIKIHESHIKKVTKGLKAKITVDAFPDEELTGEVSKVAVLPDSQNRWMNPDLKVYLTTIGVDGAREWLKPGMSAKVEIMVKKLPEVVYIPLQAVTPSQGKQICYVMNGHQPEERVVEVGDFNDEFIEIKSGLKEGEQVLLRAPEGTKPDTGEDESTPENGDKPKSEAAVASAPPPAPAAAPEPTRRPADQSGPRERRARD